jgi:hypothetical protein
MPFINGRYYVNPVMGQALEAAREAEAALAQLENRARQNDIEDAAGDEANDGFGGGSNGGRAAINRGEPIHRVEIEAAELVPAHSGHAARGYVARVHRRNSTDARGAFDDGSAAGKGAAGATHAETHVFADHRDLLGFLRDELAKDSRAGEPRRRSA